MERKEIEREIIRVKLDIEDCKDALEIVNKEINELLSIKQKLEKQLEDGRNNI